MLISTRDKEVVSSSKAILRGITPTGGLYIFDDIKPIGFDESFLNLSYQEMALKVISYLFNDIDKDTLEECIKSAYNDNNFHDGCVKTINYDGYSFLNLFNGPTFAFKDMALTLLPYFVKVSKEIEKVKNKTVVLTATSGDTGSAALNGFTKMDNTFVYVLYPYNKVSQFQEKQMFSFNGKNARSFAVKGNFDDCQRIVKEFFNNEHFNNLDLSSANSINIGRLVPQIVYYFYSYANLVNDKVIKFSDEVNFCVPTGNFGNILAGYIAKMLGLPIKKLICASNKNDVLTKFFNTLTYDCNREFYTTNSPSMDILISSNLERLLYLITKDQDYVSSLMSSLKENGKYTLDQKYSDALSCFSCASINEDETKVLIKEVYDKTSHLMDPHTAVAYGSYVKYAKEAMDNTHTVVLSTANPYKFSDTLVSALNMEKTEDEFINIKEVSNKTSVKIDDRINELSKVLTDREIWNLEDTYTNLLKVVGALDDKD